MLVQAAGDSRNSVLVKALGAFTALAPEMRRALSRPSTSLTAPRSSPI